MSTEEPQERSSNSVSPWRPPAGTEPPPEMRERSLPFSSGWPVLGGALVGVLLRFVFIGKPGAPYSAMLGAFIYLVPLVVAGVTVYMAERIEPRTWAYYAGVGFLANALFILGTLLVLIEGLICAVIIAPLFGAIGAVSGLLMGAVCRFTGRPGRTLCCAALLPLIFGAIEPNMPTEQRIRTVGRSVMIDAPPARVWHSIQLATDIRPDEVERGWIYRIGVPLPIAGVTENTPQGRVRHITMGKHVHFDQVVTEWRPERLMRVTYRYQPDSFPPYALDEHVVLGGHYFDMQGTDYELIPRGTRTEMRIRMRYRVSTSFNWYADFFARRLFDNFETVILDFYKHRSEQDVPT